MKKFICMRSNMGFCKDTECYHNSPHDPACKEGKTEPCTTIEKCEAMNIHTRCVEVSE